MRAKKKQTKTVPTKKKKVKQNKIEKKRVLAKKIAPKEKRVSKIFITKKEIPPAPKQIFKQETPAVSIGLLQHEIDELLTAHQQKESEQQLTENLVKELAAVLPKSERIKTKPDPVFKGHTDIIINNTNPNREHSPFVLDLSELVEKKKNTQEKKHLVREFLFNKQQSQPLPIRDLRPATTPAIHQAHEDVVIIQDNRPINENEILEQFTATPWYYHFNLPLNWHRKIIIYLMLCLLVVLPIKGFGYYSELQKTKTDVISYAQNAYEDLKLANTAITNNELERANLSLDSAQSNFEQAKKELENIDNEIQAILKIIPGDSANLADAEYLLQIGKLVSSVGKDLLVVTAGLKEDNGLKLTEKISLVEEKAQTLLPQLKEINESLNKIRIQAIPEEKREIFTQIKTYFDVALKDIEELASLTKALNEILGADYFKRYLVVFQNNNEIRPTGGFMGSFALVDIDQGEIKNLEIPGGGIYALQGQLLENKIAPYPLQLIQSRWELQDANWFPDFATSAEKVRWFYEKSGGPTTDGVIAINASLVPKLLDIVGPIAVPKYGLLLTAENFIEETQNTVEFGYDKNENKPKQLIADIAPTLIEKLFSLKGENMVDLIQVLKNSLSEKDIQLYFHNEAVQQKFSSYNWTGSIKDSSRDYLSIINANIRGYKTDAVIEQNYSLASKIDSNGEITNTLTITRKHTGDPTNELSGKSNVNYVRIYVPEGSQLLTATGFSDIPRTNFEPIEEHWTEDVDLLRIQGNSWIEPNSKTQINNEFGKTVFGNWIQTDPGETSEVIITYKLPFHFKFNDQAGLLNIFSKKENSTFHSIYLQKQSGVQNTAYNLSLSLPSGKKVDWVYPNDLDVDVNTINFQTTSKQDNLVAFVVE